MKRLCVIFGAGPSVPPRKTFGPSDLVIAADGGYAAAINAGLEPNVVIGDFDSSDAPKTAAHVIKLNRDKDDTDMLAAVKLGLRRGYDTFVLYGGVGGRLDHTVANIQTLIHLNAYKAQGFLVGEDTVATVFTDGKFCPPKERGTLSVFAVGGVASGVTLKNLRFPLDNVELSPSFPLGVSNETVQEDGKPLRPEITVKHGSLLVFFPRPGQKSRY